MALVLAQVGNGCRVVVEVGDCVAQVFRIPCEGINIASLGDTGTGLQDLQQELGLLLIRRRGITDDSPYVAGSSSNEGYP